MDLQFEERHYSMELYTSLQPVKINTITKEVSVFIVLLLTTSSNLNLIATIIRHFC